MDDTFVIPKEVNKQNFLKYNNSVDPAIQFTVENNKEDSAIPFSDTIVKPETDGKLSITVYRKPTYGTILTVGQSPSSLSQIQCN